MTILGLFGNVKLEKEITKIISFVIFSRNTLTGRQNGTKLRKRSGLVHGDLIMVDVKLFNGDCLEVMQQIEDHSIDAIITDLPYGTTACKWDEIIPFAPMWAQVKRVLKPRGVFVTTASQPFTSKLIMSNLKWFKYSWVWNKRLAGNGILADVQPLKIHEDVCVFADGGCNYFPQKTKGVGRWKGGIKDKHGTFGYSESTKVWNDEYNPVSILDFSGAGMRSERVHATQKPVELYEYLIRTYTNPGETVLDITAGSGTTGEAAINTGRNCILIEKDPEIFGTMKKRIEQAQAQPALLEGVLC